MKEYFMTTLIGMSFVVLFYSSVSEAKTGSFEDFMNYAEKIVDTGEVDKAEKVFTFMLGALAKTNRRHQITKTCEALISNIPGENPIEIRDSYWECPEWMLIRWLGNLDDYRRKEPIPYFIYRPFYPEEALGLKLEGEVEVEYDVDTSGNIRNVKVISSTNAIFENVVIEALDKSKYTPARLNGKPTQTVGLNRKFTFEIDK